MELGHSFITFVVFIKLSLKKPVTFIHMYIRAKIKLNWFVGRESKFSKSVENQIASKSFHYMHKSIICIL